MIRRHDPEFDDRRELTRSGEILAGGYARLVVNPFLAAAGFSAWCAGIRYATLSRDARWIFPLLATLGALYFLVQYHCLDCGTSDYVFRAGRHSCRSVLLRRKLGQALRFWPAPETQLRVWAWLLGSVAILILLISISSR